MVVLSALPALPGEKAHRGATETRPDAERDPGPADPEL